MIVAHRGERDGIHVKENTIAAFDPAVAAGVGAIEFDVRYTADNEPVVIHDADLGRVFGLPDRVAKLSWPALHERAPAIPHLADVIDRYASQAHLMIELKTRGSKLAENRLRELLAPLTPITDYHVLSLTPALFEALPDLPARACVPVAKGNWASIRRWSREHACGGLAGPFLLIRDHDIVASRREQVWLGSGFINRRGLLLREIGRGIPWLFTDRPVALQRVLDHARERAGTPGVNRPADGRDSAPR